MNEVILQRQGTVQDRDNILDIKIYPNIVEDTVYIVNTTALTKLKTVWKDRKITSKHRIHVLRSIVTSTFLYACETAELERRIQTFEMRCYRKIFGISFRNRTTNEDVRNSH